MRQWKKILRWIVAIIALIVIVLVVRTFLITSYLIPSEGMFPTLHEGERILVNKWSYGFRMPKMSWWGYHRYHTSSPKKGDVMVFNNPAQWKKNFLDEREVYIGRNMAMPGDTLYVDSLFSIASPAVYQDTVELCYPKIDKIRIDSIILSHHIERIYPCDSDSLHYICRVALDKFAQLKSSVPMTRLHIALKDSLHPLTYPLVVPSKGHAIKINPWNSVLMCNLINLHEGRNAEMKGDSLYVEGKICRLYTCHQDYYWVECDNQKNMLDSRIFGFVPNSHLIGKAKWIWFSKSKGYLPNTLRWNRIGKKIE